MILESSMLAKPYSARAKAVAFFFITISEFRIAFANFLIEHPAGRSGAKLQRFSAGHNGSDRCVANPQGRVPPVQPKHDQQLQARERLARPSASRNQEPQEVQASDAQTQVLKSAPEDSPPPRERRDWSRGSAIPVAHRERLPLPQPLSALPMLSCAP